ncbi:acyl carrier protein [Nonlabens ponticola]|uniref:Acyl carrier protein n=1 Tax=Nonlabens ponticola TaxID=2496866 RepID=A0A3S9MYN3_9FLAO|nr:phosphopantetheine-binding protein [Nonlabens ponticola]AZQ44366.1 acyl carrier protein [Nonlabens ponticola]
MTQAEIQDKLFTIVKTYLPQDVDATAIKSNSHLMNDLNINSAHLVDIALDVEDEFDIILDEKDMENMQTVEDAVRIVQEKITA